MSLPIPITPTYVGDSGDFFRRLIPMIDTLPTLFRKVQGLGLERCYTSLKGLRFVEKMERGSATLSWLDTTSDVLNIYPMAFNAGSRVDITLYTGLGARHWEKNVSSSHRSLWTNKAVQSTPSVMDKLNRTFKNGISSYSGLVNSFSSAVERLQVIHVLNTLIANSVKPSDVKLMDIYQYPPTKDFVTGNRTYSLTPLLSAYRGSTGLEMNRYEYCFAEYITEGGKIRCSEMSVERELVELFQYVSGV